MRRAGCAVNKQGKIVSIDTVESLSRLLAERRMAVARDSSVIFTPEQVRAARSGKIVLCGNDPVLTPLTIYWLMRAHFSIVGITAVRSLKVAC